jgi:hypothetical protein
LTGKDRNNGGKYRKFSPEFQEEAAELRQMLYALSAGLAFP